MTRTGHIDRLSRATLSWGIPALVFLIPWGARLIFFTGRVDGQPIEALTLSLFAVELLVFAVAALALPAVRARPSAAPRAAELLLFVLVLFAMFSTLWAPSPTLALQAAARLLMAALLFFLLVRLPDLGRVRDAFLLAVGLQAALALVQLATQSVGASTLLGVAGHLPMEAASVVESSAGRMLRAYGTLPHPNVLGGFLAAALVMALADVRGGARRRLFLAALVPFLGAGLVATFSRGAWIAAALGAAVLVVFALWRRTNGRMTLMRLSAAVLGALIVAAPCAPFLSARVAADGRLEQRSVNERRLALVQSKTLFFGSPLAGVGIGQTIPALLIAKESLLEPPHDVPALVLTELGIIGSALALAFVLALFPHTRRIGPEAAALAATAAALLAVDHYLWTSVPGLLLGAFLLACVVSDRNRPVS